MHRGHMWISTLILINHFKPPIKFSLVKLTEE